MTWTDQLQNNDSMLSSLAGSQYAPESSQKRMQRFVKTKKESPRGARRADQLAQVDSEKC